MGVMTVVSFQANGTFDALGRLRELVDLWDELGPRVWDFFQDDPQVNTLRVSRTARRDGGHIAAFGPVQHGEDSTALRRALQGSESVLSDVESN